MKEEGKYVKKDVCDELSATQSETIIQFIDVYECEICGWKTSEWSENLRPTLLSLI